MPDPATSRSAAAELLKGLWKENPVFIAVLGLCPAMAVTNSLMNALVMGAATTFVLVGSSLLVSLLRKIIPRQVRVPFYIIIIATFVTTVDFVLAALLPEAHKQLGAFIALIVVNCIILGRAEAFASKNRLLPSVLDGLGMGIGFTFALFCLGAVRELVGSGTLFAVAVFPPGYQDWVIMILPAGGFFTLAGWLILFNHLAVRRAARAAAEAAS